MRPPCRHPDRDPRFLYGERLELPGPVIREPVQPVIEKTRALTGIELFSEGTELIVAITSQPDTEDQAPAAQMIQGHRLPGQLVYAPARQRRDHRPEPQAARRGGDRAQRHPRVGHGTNRWPIHNVIP
jgi:hypothetical protein